MRTPTAVPRAAVAVALLIAVAGAHPAAHPAPFSYLDVHLADGRLSGRLVVHAVDLAYELGLGSPDPLRNDAYLERRRGELLTLLRTRLTFEADGKRVYWTADRVAALPDGDAVAFEWSAPAGRVPGHLVVEGRLFPYDSSHQTFVNLYEGGELAKQDVMSQGRTRIELYSGTRQGTFAIVRNFVASGIHHIAIGPDHVLFIVGLLLLGGTLPRLLGIVTAFTAGHGVTLALAALRILEPPAGVIEPAIALSIIYVGADNLLVGSRGRDVRVWVALAFGLIHGFGFASVLQETGLPPRALGLSLFAFNAGVEIGQALVVVAVASLLALVRKRSAPLAQRIVTVGSLGVMAAGTVWFVERVT